MHRYFLAFLLFAVGLSGPARADELDRQVRFDISAQALSPALIQFSSQTDLQIVTRAEDVSSRTTQGVRGLMPIGAGLTKLLEGTGFVYAMQMDGTVTIHALASTAPARTGNSASMAQAQLQLAENAGDSASAQGAAVVQGNRSRNTESDDSQNAGSEILVRGSKLMNADIRRTEDDVQPYVVFAAEDIARSGAGNLEEFFKARLPMNTQQTLAGQGGILTGGTTTNAGQINLRGLGASQTLILVDGRRVPSVSTGLALGQGGINGIATSAIERIEILPTTASAIYGGNATGGVINIILKRNYSGFDLAATYGETSEFDAGMKRLSLNGGFTLEEGRTRVTLGATYADQDDLLSAARNDMTRASRELLLRNNPSQVASAPIAGYTPNICATASLTSTTCSTANLVLKPALGGASLGSNFTFVPAGYAGFAGDGAVGLVANAGRVNIDTPVNSSPLSQGSTTDSLSANIRREFGATVEGFVDLYRDRTVSSTINGTGRVINVAATSPDNPFQQNLLVNLPVPNFTLPSSRKAETLRARGGVIARLQGGWSIGLEQGWSRSASSFYGESTAAPPAAGLAYLQSIALRDPNVLAIDNPAARFGISGVKTDPIEIALTETALRFSGSLYRLPAGPVALTGLLERRKQQVGDVIQETVRLNPDSVSVAWVPSASQEIRSAYVETQIPLVSAANALPFVRELKLVPAIRHDRYATRVAAGIAVTVPSRDGPFPAVSHGVSEFVSTDYVISLGYSPLPDLTFRASYSTGFLPPGLNQLTFNETPFAANSSAFAALRDPLRGNTPLIGDANGQLFLRQGGDASVRPEQSQNLSLGFVIEPRAIEGLRFSVDYVRIRKSDEITTTISNRQFTIDREAELPGRIVRGPRLAGDPVGWAGPIVLISDTALNIASTQVQAFDFQLDYQWGTAAWGDWRFYAIATHMTQRENQTLPTSAPIDTVGYSSGPLSWRGNYGVDWEAGPWLLGWNAQYFDRYHACAATALPAACGTTVSSQGAAYIPSQTYHDLYATYRFDARGALPSSLFAGAEISLGVQNALDKVPPILAGTVLTYSTYGDPRLRRFTLTVRKHF